MNDKKDIKDNKQPLKFKTVFTSEDSLHMRTAGKISIVSHKFPNLSISFKKGDRKATADSVLSLVMLDITHGDEIEIKISQENPNNYDKNTEIALKEILKILQ